MPRSFLSIIAGLRTIAVTLSAISLLVMALVGLADILLPKMFHKPFPGAFELSESLMVACVFLPLSWTQARKGHVTVGFLAPHLPPMPRRCLQLFTYLVSLFFYGILAFKGWGLALRSLAVREYASGIISFPLYPAKIVLALGLSLMMIQLLTETAQTLFDRQTER